MKSSILFKQKIYSACLQLLEKRITALSSELNDLTEGAKNDSKSSAGDKHETARAMMQIEQANIGQQLDGLLKEKNELTNIDIGNKAYVAKGSLIKTNHGYLFLSIAIGKLIIDDIPVMVLSAQSPIGKKMLGKIKEDVVEINGVKYIVEELT